MNWIPLKIVKKENPKAPSAKVALPMSDGLTRMGTRENLGAVKMFGNPFEVIWIKTLDQPAPDVHGKLRPRSFDRVAGQKDHGCRGESGRDFRNRAFGQNRIARRDIA